MDYKNNKSSNHPLILNKEVYQSNEEVIRTKNLIKEKYLIKNNEQSKSFDKELTEDFLKIKNDALILNDKITSDKLEISNSIKNKETELNLLYDKKKHLDENILNINKDKKIIQSGVISEQKILIKNNEKKLQEYFLNNRSLLINNDELKRSLSRFIEQSKKLQNEINLLKKETTLSSLSIKEIDEIKNKIKFYQEENDHTKKEVAELKNLIKYYQEENDSSAKEMQEFKNKIKFYQEENINVKKEIEETKDKMKFYQDENVRISGALIAFHKKYEVMKENFNKNEAEKTRILQQVESLNKSVNNKNILSTPFIKVVSDEPSLALKDQESSKHINFSDNKFSSIDSDDSDQDGDLSNEEDKKNLDNSINNIFNK